MEDNLVIVESPAKAKTIEKFLGKDFIVKSSYGHVRDLAKKNLGIDVKNNFEPQYEISPDKKKLVAELKSDAKKAKTVWLASDEDREGEAIAWHLYEVLGLKKENTKRIVFHEITKDAIVNAIKNPRNIDINLVDAQQARRILDRLVGFELSPVLWKKVKPALSAGRVQSVAVRLLVEREREIIGFKTTNYYKVTGVFFTDNGKTPVKAELNKRFDTKKEVLDFLEKCKSANFEVESVVVKPSKRSPASPFTTSTIQQEASRKLGLSVAQTMSIAQKLYEAGMITYMRTDSVNLSTLAIGVAKAEIDKEFGEKYSKTRNYQTKSKGAQEAHEAIRPTYMSNHTISGSEIEKKLYDLIWKRTIASQMSDAEIEKTVATIKISNQAEKFVASGEVIKFDGFLKVYIESTDDEAEDTQSTLLPAMKTNEKMTVDHILATERFTYHLPRYTEASLVKKLEELGIGRPSTYAPTISTVQNRGYVLKEDRPGVERQYTCVTLKKEIIKEENKKENSGAEKSKLFPTDIGMIVNDFLVEHFKEILNYNFTANVEKEFDEIALGNVTWHQMINKFYKTFHVSVETTLETSERTKGERLLGDDPKTGKSIIVRMGRFGLVAQIGESGNEDDKPVFASLRKDQRLESITLEEALELFKLPRDLGEYQDKKVVVAIGRFGPYVRHDSKFCSLKKDIDDPYTIQIDRAIELIEENIEKEKNKYIKKFDNDAELNILNGRWGAYISYKKNNYKIPKSKNPAELTYDECIVIINAESKKPKKSK